MKPTATQDFTAKAFAEMSKAEKVTVKYCSPLWSVTLQIKLSDLPLAKALHKKPPCYNLL